MKVAILTSLTYDMWYLFAEKVVLLSDYIHNNQCLKEEITTVRIKFNAKRYAVMLSSFLVLCLFIYVFHIVQSAIFYRTYITAMSLLVLGLGIKLSKP